jgi:hypothetical protein
MDSNHKLGLYVSYYLARFDKAAYENLGFGNQLETHDKIGELLSINPHTIKNWRDEFDPLFGHRLGWYQRPLTLSRVQVAQALDELDETQIFEIVKDILFKVSGDAEDLEQLTDIVKTDDQKRKKSKYILRCPTGKAAEKFFIDYFIENQKPIAGKLMDCRDLGVGYDFKIEGKNGSCFVEVKGVSQYSGEVLFTGKEWIVAQREGVNYFLCVVSNLNTEPNILFIQNPADKLKPKKNIYTSIQICWNVSQNQLSELYD